MHTDLSPELAAAQLARLEKVVEFSTAYWGRVPRHLIECYVAEDVNHWPDADLPHPLARVTLERIGGATYEHLEQGVAHTRRRTRFCARADLGIAEHETVHAYCMQAFGTSGPTWYKEGMAEVGRLHCNSATKLGLPCPEEYVEFFRRGPRRTLGQIVDHCELTAGIGRSLARVNAAKRHDDELQPSPSETWTADDDREVATALESYRWNWALCYFLSHNPNYSDRFRQLGRDYLQDPNASFDIAFANVRAEADFEYAFFLDRFDVGYRVDLCRWDWTTPTRSLHGNQRAELHVVAARGYQATGVSVNAGDRYTYRCQGNWRISDDQPKLDADGDAAGTGRLEGAILGDQRLGEPFSMGAEGVFVAPSDGQLFVRCRDAWNQLEDNEGRIALVIAIE